MSEKQYNFFTKSYVINFNWAKIYLLITFLTYGFYAVISKYNNDIFTILTVLILFFFYYLSHKFKNYFSDKLSFQNYEILIFFAFTLILIIINYNFLNLSLFGDELAHSIRASRTSIFGILTILDKFEISYFDNTNFRHLVHFVNFFLLIFLISVIILFLKFNNIYTIFLIIFLTIAFRIFLKDLGMHPPLDHIFSFIFFSIFGITDFTANASYLFGFAILQLYLFKLINKKLSIFLSFFSSISIFTIPLLISMSTWTESAIWSAMFFTLIILELFFFREKNYLRIISIISIATLFRVSIFITLLPLVLFYIQKIVYEKSFSYSDLKKITLSFTPTLVFLPFVFNSIILGTPSFSGINQEIDNNLSIFEKLNLAFETNIIWISVLNSIEIIWIIFIPFIFIFRINTLSILLIILYFLFSISVYYSIEQNLWGLAKYVSEYALPFCILGFLNLIYFLKKKKIHNNIIIFFLILLISTNIFQFFKAMKYNKSHDQIINSYEKEIKTLNNDLKYFNYKLVYNLKDAFDYIDKKNLQGSTLLVGTTYGILPEIINNYTVRQIFMTKKIIDKQNELKKSKLKLIDRISQDKNIKALMLTDVKNINLILKDLNLNGWKLEKKFINKKFGSTIYLLII